MDCVDQALSCPYDETKQLPVDFNLEESTGTAYEGFVKVPNPKGGIRKGWIRMFVVVSDFKLFLYDIFNTGDPSDSSNSKLNTTASISANTIIDMRYVQYSFQPYNDN